MPATIYEAIWIFFIYAFIGWCTEVSYVGLNEGHFVNRGFLSGTYCPIYGFGVLLVVSLLTPIKNNLLLLFLGSVALTTLLEYLTGLILDKIFKQRWWDYSDVPFNIQGYVCPKFAVFWGLGCMFVVRVLHPHILTVIHWLNGQAGKFMLGVAIIIFVLDFLAAVDIAWDKRRDIVALERVANSVKNVSDGIGKGVYVGVSAVADKVGDAKELVEKIKEERRSVKDGDR